MRTAEQGRQGGIADIAGKLQAFPPVYLGEIVLLREYGVPRMLAASFKVAPRILDAYIAICNFGWLVFKKKEISVGISGKLKQGRIEGRL